MAIDIKNTLLIESKLERAKGTTRYEAVLAERTNFYRENPSCREIASNIRDEKGNLTEQGKNKLEEYESTLLQDTIMHNINSAEKINIENLKPNERKNYVRFLLIAANDFESERAFDTLVDLCNIDTSKITDLAHLNEMVYEAEFNEKLDNDQILENLKAVKTHIVNRLAKTKKIEKTTKTFEERLESLKISEQEFEKMYEEESEELVYDGTDFEKTELENYFDNSNVNFTKEDVENFKKLNTELTVNSWIENRDDALKYQYSLLHIAVLKVYGSNHEKILKQSLESFEKYPGMLEKLEGDYFEGMEEVGENFIENKLDFEILRRFSKNMSKQENYNDMNSIEKSDYLSFLLTAKQRARTTTDPMKKSIFEKFVNISFEAMNTEDKQYISFDSNGSVIINEENLLKEFLKVNEESDKMPFEYEIKSTLEEQENEVANIYKYGYVNNKMAIYAGRDESEFQKLTATSPEGKLMEIQQILLMKEQEKQFAKTENILNTELGKAIKNEQLKESDEKTFSETEKESAEINNQKIENESENQLEEIEDKDYLVNENQGSGIINRFKEFIKQLKTPKLSDGTEKKAGMLSKILNGIKSVFNKDEAMEDNKQVADSKNDIKLDSFDARIAYSVNAGSLNKESKLDLNKKTAGNQVTAGVYGEDDDAR